MPLDLGHSWSYSVNLGLDDSRYESIKVVRPVAVDGVEGVELNGNLGLSRMAWKGNSLVVESACNLRFSPALPLLPADGKSTDWKGSVTWMGRPIQASAHVLESPRSIKLGSKTIASTESDVILSLPSKDISLVTWFQPGVGIVKQEQRTKDTLNLGLEMTQDSPPPN